MIEYKKSYAALLSILVIVILFYYHPINKNTEESFLQNKITLTSNVNITDLEKEQIKKSVDFFMSEYKLPKSVPSSYKILVENILNDSIKIIVNQFETGDAGNVVIYARKINGVWQVDSNSGPWCTLETFSDKTCI
jgi:hypothetical protein